MSKESSYNPNLAKNYMILVSGEMVAKLLTFAAFAFLARVLRPEGFGSIEFVLALIFVFSLVVDFGFDKFGAVSVAKDKSMIPKLTSHIVILRSMLAVVAIILLTAVVMFLNKPMTVKKLVMLYGISLFELPFLLKWVFQGCDQMKWVAFNSILRQAVFCLGIFIFIRESGQTMLVAIIEIASLGSTAACFIILYRYYFHSIKFRLDINFSKNILIQSLPIGLSQLMFALKVYLSIIILGVLVEQKEVGWFGASHRIVIALNTFGMLYFFNLLPSISRCSLKTSETLCRLMRNSLNITLWGAVLISIYFTVFADELIYMIYGPFYKEGVIVLQFLIWFFLVAIISGHYRTVLVGMGKQNYDLVSTSTGVVAAIILNILLIYRYGIVGAALAILISEIVTLFISYYFVQREIAHIPVMSHLAKPLTTGIIIIMILKIIPDLSFLISSVTLISLYTLVFYLFHPHILSDIRNLATESR